MINQLESAIFHSMLKRQQILINNWLIDHLQEVAKKYDISYSELVRVMLCCNVIKNTRKLFPDEDIADMEKEYAELIEKKNDPDTYEPEDLHNFISKVYFEARKAAEIWNKNAPKE